MFSCQPAFWNKYFFHAVYLFSLCFASFFPLFLSQNNPKKGKNLQKSEKQEFQPAKKVHSTCFQVKIYHTYTSKVTQVLRNSLYGNIIDIIIFLTRLISPLQQLRFPPTNPNFNKASFLSPCERSE